MELRRALRDTVRTTLGNCATNASLRVSTKRGLTDDGASVPIHAAISLNREACTPPPWNRRSS